MKSLPCMRMTGRQFRVRAYTGQKITAKQLKATRGKESVCGNALLNPRAPYSNLLY